MPWSRVRHFWNTLKRTGREFFQGEPMTEAGSLAYTTIFALPGVLIMALMVASTFYDEGAVREALYGQAGALIGNNTAKDLESIVQSANRPKSGDLARVLGVIALAVSATTLFASLQSSLNRIWGVKQKPGKAVVRYLLTRLTSLALIGSFGFLLLVSLILDAAMVAVGERLGAWLPASTVLVGVLSLCISFAVVTTVFAMVFKFLPDMRIAWRTVWSGALFTAALFTVGKYLIGLYIAKTGAGDAYGAGGAVIIIMLWVYYSAILTLFGAQFTFVTAKEHGERMKPLPHAEKQPARSV
ncbi:MAG: YihY/virulence factor BrkB family protein [Flavobacteriales bacterium]|nr:YihY/virulence factor BrkB family protein [Flavobacteriales bacterium]